MEVTDIAKVCHETNRTYCECMGFKILPPWEEVSEHIKQSAIDGVTYHIDNPESRPEDAHNNWKKFKEADGWRYCKDRDDSKKLHNCLLPYDLLNQKEKAKDYIFMTICKQLKPFLIKNS